MKQDPTTKKLVDVSEPHDGALVFFLWIWSRKPIVAPACWSWQFSIAENTGKALFALQWSDIGSFEICCFCAARWHTMIFSVQFHGLHGVHDWTSNGRHIILVPWLRLRVKKLPPEMGFWMFLYHCYIKTCTLELQGASGIQSLHSWCHCFMDPWGFLFQQFLTDGKSCGWQKARAVVLNYVESHAFPVFS